MVPRLEILPPPQRALWPELVQIPKQFVLYGGTAIALRLGHRQSVDFDFFSFQDIDPGRLLVDLDLLRSARTLDRRPNTLTVLIERSGPIQISFFGLPRLKQLQPPDQAVDNAIKIASFLDLAGTKASVIQVRAEAKDYLDLDAIMTSTSIDLPSALSAAGAIYGTSFNPQVTLKALSYFEDGNLSALPDAIRERLATAARSVDLDHLPAVECFTQP